MKPVVQIISALALAAIPLIAVLFSADRLTLPTAQNWILGVTIVWFVATPLWMGREPHP